MNIQPSLFDQTDAAQFADMQMNQFVRVHKAENNIESQQRLIAKEKHFSKKCMELLVRLCNGERLQFAKEVLTIGDLRRRSLDLIENGIPVQREFVGDIKEYFLKDEDITWVKEKYLK